MKITIKEKNELIRFFNNNTYIDEEDGWRNGDLYWNNEMFEYCGTTLSVNPNETLERCYEYEFRFGDDYDGKWYFTKDWCDTLKSKLDRILND
jgi:hypothetical protein